MNQHLYAMLPKVDEWLDLHYNEIYNDVPHTIVLKSLRYELDRIRQSIREGIDEKELNSRIEELANIVPRRAKKMFDFRLKRVINGTGVIIHTNLGRSLIASAKEEHVNEICSRYSNLEYDLDRGERGSRYIHLSEVISEITGAEDAMVVNNNAAAVMLVLSTFAKGKEVVVSRGEMIEIGGAFRIPDVMETSGAFLRSVGTTNKTHLWDYEDAIGEETAALMKIHTSNYRIVGFTESVSAQELVSLAGKHQIPLIEDLGSGVLIDLSLYGLEREPTVQDSVRAGVDIITFSGDKLLGGTQAGIIVGRKKYIDKLKKNPLTRALRVDKYTISCLEAIFREYYEPEKAVENIPTLRMLSEPSHEIEKRIRIIQSRLEEKLDKEKIFIDIAPSYSEVGGGSMPLEKIPTFCLTVSLREIPINRFEEALRHLEIPLIARISEERIWVDFRTVQPDEGKLVEEAICKAYDSVKERIKI